MRKKFIQLLRWSWTEKINNIKNVLITLFYCNLVQGGSRIHNILTKKVDSGRGAVSLHIFLISNSMLPEWVLVHLSSLMDWMLFICFLFSFFITIVKKYPNIYITSTNLIARWNHFGFNLRLIISTIATGNFLIVLWLWRGLDSYWPTYQSVFKLVDGYFALDGLSINFLLLTTFLFAVLSIYLIFDWKMHINYINLCLLIEIFLLFSFSTTNLLIFYIFFESVLIPMFLMIIFWGSSQRKIKAAIYFLIYTLIGSIFLLFAIIYIYNAFGTLNYQNFEFNFLSKNEEIVLWIAFFLPFAVKIPMFPFHIWLPEAHVEAPTLGSIILASLLLKLGGYGFIRFTIPLFPYANDYFFPLITMLSITGILNASLAAMRQVDIKRIIAYSSIGHMNLIVLGIFSQNECSQIGSVYLMIGHGIVSAALFFCVGVLYDRYHTRLIHYYGGLAQTMPKFTFFFLVFSFANMGFPGTINFIGEFLILVGIFDVNFVSGVMASLSTVLSAIYSIYLFNRINFGTIKSYMITKNFIDLTTIEFFVLLLLLIISILLGLNANLILISFEIGSQI